VDVGMRHQAGFGFVHVVRAALFLTRADRKPALIWPRKPWLH
jgi:hypothetical protein